MDIPEFKEEVKRIFFYLGEKSRISLKNHGIHYSNSWKTMS